MSFCFPDMQQGKKHARWNLLKMRVVHLNTSGFIIEPVLPDLRSDSVNFGCG